MANRVDKSGGMALAPWKWLLLPWMAAVICMAYLWAGDLPQFQSPQTARIIFWHVPMAMLSLVWFWVAAFYSFRYLTRRDEMDDVKASRAAEVGLLLTVLATLTGAVFSKMQWAGGLNSPWYEGYWQWDPQQISILLVIVYFAAYFALRLSIDDETQRGRFSAVYALIGAAAVPFIYFVLPKLPVFGTTIHPESVIRKGMDVPYRVTYWSATFGFLGISLWAYQLRLRVEALAARRAAKGTLIETTTRTEAVRKPVTEP
ncbi:MAG: cytochrome c biogenesis protein CcsA [Armatimonadota bacterium]